MTDIREGGCQCGAVRYQVQGDPVATGICHCTECQRQSGSAFGMSFIVPKAAFRLLNGQLKTFTRESESRRSVVCAFCPDCGNRIYHEAQWMAGVLNIKPGTLDDTSFLQPRAQIWTAKKQPWLDLTGLQSFEGQPY